MHRPLMLQASFGSACKSITTVGRYVDVVSIPHSLDLTDHRQTLLQRLTTLPTWARRALSEAVLNLVTSATSHCRTRVLRSVLVRSERVKQQFTQGNIASFERA